MPSEDKKTHTDSEVELLLAVNEVKTMQKMHLELFNDHKAEDSEHFDRLYEADKKILSEIQEIPARMINCSEKIKTDILSISRNEFATITDFKVLKTWIITGIVAGSAVAGIISTALNYVIAVMKIGGG